MLKPLVSDTFDSTISSLDTALVLFWADWASPSVDLFNRLKIVETDIYTVDIDTYADIAHRCKIVAAPTLHAYKKGKLLGWKVGLIGATTAYLWYLEKINESSL